MAIRREQDPNRDDSDPWLTADWQQRAMRERALQDSGLLIPAARKAVPSIGRSRGAQSIDEDPGLSIAPRPSRKNRASNWVLVIDDVASIRSILKRMLTRHGYKVVDAPNLATAYDQFRSLSIRVLVLDLIIPDCELTSSFRHTLQCFPGANAIAMSGGGRCGSTNLLSVAEQLGAAATLSKPFATRQLLELVDKLWKA